MEVKSNYRALENVHPSLPAETSPSTINHSITLDINLEKIEVAPAKLSQLGEESLGESSSLAGGPLCTTGSTTGSAVHYCPVL